MNTRITNIVFVTAPQAQMTDGLRRAMALAQAVGATLHLFLPDHDNLILAVARHAEVYVRAKRDFLVERRQRIEDLAKQINASGVRIEAEVAWALALPEAVIAKSLEIGAQLIVKDFEKHSLLERLVSGPGDLRLLRMAPCDVLMVKHPTASSTGTVVASVDVLAEDIHGDFSLNDRICGRALYVAEALGATLDVISSFSVGPPLTPVAFDVEAVCKELNDNHKALFDAFTSKNRIPSDQTHRLNGGPAFAISEFAKQHHVDLVVLGSVYRSTFDRFLLGSTAEILLSTLPCDVWLVKPAAALETLQHLVNIDALRKQFKRDQEMNSSESVRE